MNWIDGMIRFAYHDPDVNYEEGMAEEAADAIMEALDRVREERDGYRDRVERVQRMCRAGLEAVR